MIWPRLFHIFRCILKEDYHLWVLCLHAASATGRCHVKRNLQESDSPSANRHKKTCRSLRRGWQFGLVYSIWTPLKKQIKISWPKQLNTQKNECTEMTAWIFSSPASIHSGERQNSALLDLWDTDGEKNILVRNKTLFWDKMREDILIRLNI